MQPDQNNNVVENKEVVQQQNTEIKPVEQETPEQINWKKFREAREVERKQKEAAEKLAAQKAAEAEALKQAMEALLNKQTPQVSQSNSYEEETEDQRIQKKVEEALLVQQRQFEEQRRQREQAEFPQRLVQTYQDFNQVCTADNLDYLEYHFPEVAAPFKHLPDGFDKWSDVYKAVKRFVPNTESKKEQARAEKNFSKPQSMAASGVTQTGDTAPVMLDDKRRADNWARMQRIMRNGK